MAFSFVRERSVHSVAREVVAVRRTGHTRLHFPNEAISVAQYHFVWSRGRLFHGNSKGVPRSMNNIKTAVLLAALSGLLIAVGGALGGASGALTFFFIALAMNLGSYWFSADIVLRTSRAHEITADQDPPLFAQSGR